MTPEFSGIAFSPPESFVVEVLSEFPQETVQRRWHAINVLLRLSMLSGLHMQLDAVLSLLCDFAAEMVPHHSALVCLTDDNSDQQQLRVVRGIEDPNIDLLTRANILNVWAARRSRPLIVTHQSDSPANILLDALNARCALVLPLFVSNRVSGTLQLFSSRTDSFTAEDAQLLWILSLVAEPLLTRDYANDGLIQLAFTDYLTGLKTRGYFEQQLELEIKRSERKKSNFALLMIDIDFFKSLNDRYGHHVGDQVLRDVSSILMRDMREVDTVARYGGEEFVIILPETNAVSAKPVADRLRRAVEHSKFFAGSPNVVERLTISIGQAIFPDDGQFRSQLIENADTALYHAKAHGRNQVALYRDIQRFKKQAG